MLSKKRRFYILLKNDVLMKILLKGAADNGFSFHHPVIRRSSIFINLFIDLSLMKILMNVKCSCGKCFGNVP